MSIKPRRFELIVFELLTLSWIRARFFGTGFLRSFASVALGGAIIAAVSAGLGSVLGSGTVG